MGSDDIDKAAAWNTCPTCGELVDIDDESGDGSEVRCMACNARLVVTEYADDTFGLVLADEGDPADGQDPLDPETPEAVVEEQAPELGLDPDALRRRGEAFGRGLCEAAADIAPDRLDALDRLAREAAERVASVMALPWRAGRTDPDPIRASVPALSAALQAATAEIRRLRERETRLVHERECLGSAIANAAMRAGIYSGLPVTGPELILLCQEMGNAILRSDVERDERVKLGEMAVSDGEEAE